MKELLKLRKNASFCLRIILGRGKTVYKLPNSGWVSVEERKREQGRFLCPGRIRRPQEVPPKAKEWAQKSSRDSATFSSPEAGRNLSWLLTRANDDHCGAREHEFAARLGPNLGGNLQGRTDRAHVPPSNRKPSAFRSAVSRTQLTMGFSNSVPGGGRNKNLPLPGLNLLLLFFFFLNVWGKFKSNFPFILISILFGLLRTCVKFLCSIITALVILQLLTKGGNLSPLAPHVFKVLVLFPSFRSKIHQFLILSAILLNVLPN